MRKLIKTGIIRRIPNELDFKIQEISKTRKLKFSQAGRELVKEYDMLKCNKEVFRRIRF